MGNISQLIYVGGDQVLCPLNTLSIEQHVSTKESEFPAQKPVG